MRAKAKFLTMIEDVNAIEGEKKNDVEIVVVAGHGFIKIKPKGYGDFSSSDGHGIPIFLEVYEGRLRLIVWPDINEQEPTIIDMEGARETARIKEKRIIESNSLPISEMTAL